MTQQSLRFGTLRLMRDATLGAGAYGQVCKATLDELPCAAKLLHPVLVDLNNPRNRTRFEQECRFLSEIRHPNIVQHLGVAQDGETGLPVLLMELMDDSLTHFLEQSEEPLAYHVQVNISHDIALAIAFLHLNRIVHRDLSSNNVLLIGAGHKAKVTDFGMSRLSALSPRMTGLTKRPAILAYMSPEAMFDPPVYTEKLDCFQAGVLMIQTITCKFPDPGPAMKRVRDARNPEAWTNAPVSEVERRQNHLSLVPQTHPMLRVAMNCLKDVDSDRPSSQSICRDLSALKEAPEYGQSLEGEEERDGGKQLIHQMRQEREREVGERKRKVRGEVRRIKEGEGDVEDLQSQLQQKEGEIKDMGREIKRLQNIIWERESGGIQGLQEASESSALLLHEEEQIIHQPQQTQQSAPSYTCLVSGPGLQSATANHPTHVIVELSDSSGSPCSLQQNVTAELQSPAKSYEAAVDVISPTCYKVSYIAVRRGQHKLHIQINGSEINGSPFIMTVYPDPVQLGPSKSVVITGLKSPYGIAVNSHGEMVVTESQEDGQGLVSVFDVRGQRVRTFGSHGERSEQMIGQTIGTDGDKPEQMIRPAGIAVDDMDNIYVSSQYKLQKFTNNGELIKCVSRWSSKEGGLDDPCRVVTHRGAAGVTIHSNQVYVCDRDNHRIQVFDLDLNFIQYIGSHGAGSGKFNQPYDVAFDTAGNMYVVEYRNRRVQVLNGSGQHIREFGKDERNVFPIEIHDEKYLKAPTAIHIADDYVYVSDWGIAVYQTSGHFVTSFGYKRGGLYQYGWQGHGEEVLSSPRYITTCTNGLIHVCDKDNNQVLTF